MKLYHKLHLTLLSLFSLVLVAYSYTLIDLNLTFFNDDLWLLMRNQLIQIGYYQRELSSYIFLALVAASFYFHWVFVKHYKKVSLKNVIIPIAVVGVLSYPFLTHDFFNYMFDAKILTFYHQNPYMMKALDFPQDPWLRFMHWTHRSYPYGPSFLPISLIPSFFSFGKFVLGFYLFKITTTLFYLAGVWSLSKLSKKSAVFFATSPLVIFEGLVNSHNDLISIGLALLGIAFIFSKKKILSRVFLLLSGGIKYITLPLVFLSGNKRHIVNKISLGLLTAILLYLSIKQEIQPWYFLALLPMIVYFENIIMKLNLFFAGLLFSYYPYVRFGGWDASWKVDVKHQIIIVFLILNAVYFLARMPKKAFFKR